MTVIVHNPLTRQRTTKKSKRCDKCGNHRHKGTHTYETTSRLKSKRKKKVFNV
ncbi:unnamed protein product [Ectocarpus sp. 8 AP-2014]